MNLLQSSLVLAILAVGATMTAQAQDRFNFTYHLTGFAQGSYVDLVTTKGVAKPISYLCHEQASSKSQQLCVIDSPHTLTLTTVKVIEVGQADNQSIMVNCPADSLKPGNYTLNITRSGNSASCAVKPQ